MSTPLTLVAIVLALLAVAALGQGAREALGGAFARPTQVDAVVVGHEPITKEVVVGGRGERKQVELTRVALRYDAAGEQRTLYADRAPELAARDFPIGKRRPVWFRAAAPDDGSLEPQSFALFPLVLLAAGVLLLGAAIVLFTLARKA